MAILALTASRSPINMIQLTGAGKRFGPKILFEDLELADHARRSASASWARNGTGKSTLLKVLAGIEALDYGSHQRCMKGIRAGYLPQDGLTLTGRTRLRRMHVGVRRHPRAGSGAGSS